MVVRLDINEERCDEGRDRVSLAAMRFRLFGMTCLLAFVIESLRIVRTIIISSNFLGEIILNYSYIIAVVDYAAILDITVECNKMRLI